MTRVKIGVVDNYIKKNPHAPLNVVIRETGCSYGTFYLARRRLGLPTRALDQHAMFFDTVTGVQPKAMEEQPKQVVAEQPKPTAKAVEAKPKQKKPAAKTTVINTAQPSAYDQIASVQEKLDFATTVNKALVAAVVVLAFVGAVPLVLPYFK